MLEVVYARVVLLWIVTLVCYGIHAILFNQVERMNRPSSVKSMFIHFWINDEPVPPSFRPVFRWYRVTNIVFSVSLVTIFLLWLISGAASRGDHFGISQWNMYGRGWWIVVLSTANITLRFVIWQIICQKERIL